MFIKDITDGICCVFILIIIFFLCFCANENSINNTKILIDIEIELHQDVPSLNKKQYSFLTKEQKEFFWNKKGIIKE